MVVGYEYPCLFGLARMAHALDELSIDILDALLAPPIDIGTSVDGMLEELAQCTWSWNLPLDVARLVNLPDRKERLCVAIPKCELADAGSAVELVKHLSDGLSDAAVGVTDDKPVWVVCVPWWDDELELATSGLCFGAHLHAMADGGELHLGDDAPETEH